MNLRMNGWQRAWVVSSVTLGLAIGLLLYGNSSAEGAEVLWGLLLWVLIVGIPLYALGWSVAWVIRGFKAHR